MGKVTCAKTVTQRVSGPLAARGHFAEEAIIRVVLDNHSAHISKETMA